MTMIYVQFKDSSQTELESVFGGQQDPTAWPNQGQVQASDARYKAFFNGLIPIVKPSMPQPE